MKTKNLLPEIPSNSPRGRYANYYPSHEAHFRVRKNSNGKRTDLLGLQSQTVSSIVDQQLVGPVKDWLGASLYRKGSQIISVILLTALMAGLLLPVIQSLYIEQRYVLTAVDSKLASATNPNLAGKITFNAQRQLYQFNKDSIQSPSANTLPLMNLKAQLGGTGKKDVSLYSIDAPVDLSQGLTYYDNAMGLSFTLVPQFQTLPGREVDGRLVYPLTDGGVVSYSFKANGLKEDIILNRSPAKGSLKLGYELQLPSALQAKLIPETGALGLYSADPTLFGNISYGSSSDQALVNKARVASPKTHLTFVLPPPTIKESNGSNGAADARFVLHGDTLQLVAANLSGLAYPLSIDPSVVITSSADFSSGNNEGDISYPSGQINRGGVSGGSIGSAWITNPTSFATTRSSFASVAYNGYLYVLGGTGSLGAVYNDVQYAPINSDGTVGAWTATTSFANARYGLGAIAYNGYVYVLGGYDGNATYFNDVQYAPINSNGTVGNWAATTSFSTGRDNFGYAVYNGYLYIMGGIDGNGTLHNDVQYTSVSGTGTVGTWTTDSTSFTTPREELAAVAYNGYLYIMGGYETASPNFLGDVQYAPINSDGTVGAWTATTSFANARLNLSAVVYNGYLYIMGGYNGTTYFNDVQYAPINSNGTVGTWDATTSFTTPREELAAVAYNGYLYIMGGINGATFYNDVQYAPINSGGVTATYNTTASFTGTRNRFAAVAYNGYLYIMGGINGATFYNDVQYAPINSDGSVGAWTATTSFTNARDELAAVAYNGYLYIMGGTNGTTSYNDVQYASISSTGTVGTWTTSTNSFTNARTGLGAVAYNGHLYIMGGSSGSSGYYNDVQYASISSTGTVGTWTTSTNSFTNARYSFGTAVYGGYLYIMGGMGKSSVKYNDVQYAPINADGSVGTWTTSTNSFTNARFRLAAVAYNGYLYIMGGYDGTTFYNDVQYAPINADGSIGTWMTNTSFTTGRWGLAGAAYDGYLYIMGGQQSGGTNLNDVQYAQINNGGSGMVGAWTATTSFATTRYDFGSVAYNGHLYVMGGTNTGSNYFNDVQFAQISSTGALVSTLSSCPNGGTLTGGTWCTTTSFTNARYGFGALAYNGYLYIMGGNSGSTQSDVQFAQINSNGTVGTWNTTTSLPSGRVSSSDVIYNGYLYAMGGMDSGNVVHNDVQFAQISSTGALVSTLSSCPNGGTLTGGTWCTTTSFTNARYRAGSVAYNGYLYILGGGTLSTRYNDVQYAPINSNGTLGNWAATTSFSTVRADFGAAVYNGYLYIMGGTSGAFTSFSDVQYAPINSNGTLGNWAATTALPSSRWGLGTVTYNGYVYMAGGGGASGTVNNDAQYAPLSSISRIGHYSKLIDLGGAVLITSIAYGGTLSGGLSAISYKIAGTNGVFGSEGNASTLNVSSGNCSVSGSTAGRYVWISLTLDDTQHATFPDVNSSPSNVTDVTINYSIGHAPPNLRLRGGAWFSAQVLQPLDTCGP